MIEPTDSTIARHTKKADNNTQLLALYSFAEKSRTPIFDTKRVYACVTQFFYFEISTTGELGYFAIMSIVSANSLEPGGASFLSNSHSYNITLSFK